MEKNKRILIAVGISIVLILSIVNVSFISYKIAQHNCPKCPKVECPIQKCPVQNKQKNLKDKKKKVIYFKGVLPN